MLIQDFLDFIIPEQWGLQFFLHILKQVGWPEETAKNTKDWIISIKRISRGSLKQMIKCRRKQMSFHKTVLYQAGEFQLYTCTCKKAIKQMYRILGK